MRFDWIKIPGASLVAKAVVAGVTSGYTMFDALITDNSVSAGEWARIGAAVAVSSVMTWATPNATPPQITPPPAQPKPPDPPKPVVYTPIPPGPPYPGPRG